jgi:hypothetical protein
MKHAQKRWPGWLMISIGTALLIVTGVGQWTDRGGYHSVPPRSWERFDQELVKRTPDLPSLLEEAEQRTGRRLHEMPPGEAMEVLHGIVTERFTHADAQHTPFTNWILWVLGVFHPALGHIWNADLTVAKGHSLSCDQASYLLLALALKSGIQARHVGLDGHVVMEAWYDGDWHLYDPDMEIIPKDERGDVLSVDELSQNTELLQKFYSGPRKDAVPLFTTRENNTFMSYPIGARFEWKCQVLSIFEKFMNLLKWIVPIVLVWWGIRLVRRRPANTHLHKQDKPT